VVPEITGFGDFVYFPPTRTLGVGKDLDAPNWCTVTPTERRCPLQADRTVNVLFVAPRMGCPSSRHRVE
jgi:hypothetical protein